MKTDTPKGPRRSQNLTEDKYLKRAKLLRQESSAFLRMMAVITIFIIGAALSFLVLGDNAEFLEKHFGKDSIITKVFANVSKEKETKQKNNRHRNRNKRKQDYHDVSSSQNDKYKNAVQSVDNQQNININVKSGDVENCLKDDLIVNDELMKETKEYKKKEIKPFDYSL